MSTAQPFAFGTLSASVLAFLGACSQPAVQQTASQPTAPSQSTTPETLPRLEAANSVSDNTAGQVPPEAELTASSGGDLQIALPVIDPACLLNVAWFSEREAADITLNGCRSQALIPAKDEDGSRRHEAEDGSWIMSRHEKTQSNGRVSFEVIYNGGGTLAGKYQVTGTPNAAGVLKVGQFTIVPLS